MLGVSRDASVSTAAAPKTPLLGVPASAAGLGRNPAGPPSSLPRAVCTGRVRLGWRAWFVAAAWAASATNWCCAVACAADTVLPSTPVPYAIGAGARLSPAPAAAGWGRVACCAVVVVADKTRGPRGLCAASLAMTVRARPPRGGGGGGRSGGFRAGGPAVSMLHRGPVSERDGFSLLHSTAVMGSYSCASPKLRLPAPAVGAAISASIH